MQHDQKPELNKQGSKSVTTGHRNVQPSQDLRPTFAFQWHITDECDQRCKHCYLFSEDARMACKSMTWDDMLQVLDSCYDLCERMGRQPYFYITGGDPILHRDFWRLAEELHARSAMWCIMGNPFHLADEVCRRMRELGCRKYQLSLDGSNAATHDLFRKPGSFDDTLRAAACIKRSGMWLALMSTVSSMNADELPDMIDLAARIDADVFAFGRYCPTKGQRLEEFHMEPLEYRALLVRCQERIDALVAAGCKTTFQKKDHLWTLLDWEQGRFRIPEGAQCGKVYDGCHCGIAHMTVLPTGDVYACRRMESKIGNVHEESMYDLFMGQNMEAHREFSKFEKCSRCELAGWCRGCPAVAAGYTGNMYAPDPQCWKEVD